MFKTIRMRNVGCFQGVIPCVIRLYRAATVGTKVLEVGFQVCSVNHALP